MACCNIKVRIGIAVIGVLVGLVAFFSFGGRFRNYNAAGFGLVSGILAAVTLWVHVKHKNGTLRALYKYLRSLMLLGCLGQLAGVSSFVAYVSLGAVLGQGLSDVYGENYWIACVWSWMTWKWGFQLLWFTREYRNSYEEERRSLLNKTEEVS